VSESDEPELFATLAQNPADESTRMVYADFLEQHGYDKLARFVRGQLDPAVVNVSDLRWRAITSRAPVQCERKDCPKTWDRMATTETFRIRHCLKCDHYAVYCGRPREAATAGGDRRLVVVFDVRDKDALVKAYDHARHPWKYGTVNPPPPGYSAPPPKPPLQAALDALDLDES
jgi:uncharacterized protein (TIGR02996 family)